MRSYYLATHDPVILSSKQHQFSLATLAVSSSLDFLAGLAFSISIFFALFAFPATLFIYSSCHFMNYAPIAIAPFGFILVKIDKRQSKCSTSLLGKVSGNCFSFLFQLTLELLHQNFLVKSITYHFSKYTRGGEMKININRTKFYRSGVGERTFISSIEHTFNCIPHFHYIGPADDEHVYSPVVLFYLVCLYFAGDFTLHPLILE